MLLSDPRPAYCSACHNANPELRYVDFDAAHDGGAYFDRETLAYEKGSDDLHVCESCVRDAMEVLELQPEQLAKVQRELREERAQTAFWKQTAKRMEGYLQERPEIAPGAPKRRKAAA